MKKNMLVLLLWGLFQGVRPGTAAVRQAATPHTGTNVLFIAIDDMKPLLGCYGDTQAVTPHIDRLAAGGVTFMNAQCQWAVCGASRASLSTGLYPEETGVMGFTKMRGKADKPERVNKLGRPNVITIQQWFRYNGYRTAATGKINDFRCVGTLDPKTGNVAEDGGEVDDPPSWGDPVNPGNLPRDFFSNSAYVKAKFGVPGDGNSTSCVDKPDVEFTDSMICDTGLSLMQLLADGDSPFFLGVGFHKPHLPFVAPKKYWDYYRRSDFKIHPFQLHPKNEVSYTWNNATEIRKYPDIPAMPNVIPEAKQLELIHGYYACASFVDVQVGRLLTELDALGLSGNTIVILCGDHGFHLGDHAEWAKHTNLEQAARVPLIVFDPFADFKGGKVLSPVNFVDIYPTLCDLTGLPKPEQPLASNENPFTPAAGRSIKGKSIVPLMQDPAASVRTGALTLFERRGTMGYSFRTERYRYIEWIGKKSKSVDAQELYDYEKDPMETINLAGNPEYAALVHEYSVSMRAELDGLKKSVTDLAAPRLQLSSPR